MYILGISAFYHDSAAVLLLDDDIIAAVQEERFTRVKHDSSFPENAIKFCLDYAGITLYEVDHIVFYDKPFLKFERLLLTYLAEVPKGFLSFSIGVPVWLKEKLFLKNSLVRGLREIEKIPKKILRDRIYFSEHHLSHASSAFFPSPFQESAIITSDGVGEWTTTSIAYGKGKNLEILKEIKFPHSLGLLYSAFTYYTGFKVNSGEYKMMGLAPYGEPKYYDLIMDNIIDLKDDGSLKLNMEYFNFTSGLTMTNDKFNALFGGIPRKMESIITVKDMDIAASIQQLTNEVMLKTAKFAKELTACKNLCMAGGVALNCVSNGKILKSGLFDNIWIQPAAGDAGGALGAALAYYYTELEMKRSKPEKDSMKGSYLGPEFNKNDIKSVLEKSNAVFDEKEDFQNLCNIVSDEIIKGCVIGWFRGRMEFGPRALGNRSIIGDSRNPEMQKRINLKIKFREGFRPFAPSILDDYKSDFFDMESDSPYMLIVAELKESKRKNIFENYSKGLEKLKLIRSEIPAVTHVDYSARVQTVHKETNPDYYNLIETFYKKTGCPVIVNTSFNVRGEPIVCNPEEAFRCFMRTEMDVLVLENFILYKDKQSVDFDITQWNP